jgi:hypothetical protein
MKITRRKTKTGCTITVKAESDADKRQLTEAMASGVLQRALEVFSHSPESIELIQVLKTKAPRG